MPNNKRLADFTNYFTTIFSKRFQEKLWNINWTFSINWQLSERKNKDWLQLRKGANLFTKIINKKACYFKGKKYRKFKTLK